MLFLPVIGRLEPETPSPRSKNMQLGALQQRVLSIRKALKNRLGAGVLSNHLLLLSRITILNDSKKLLEVKVGGCPSLHYLNEAMLRGTMLTCTTAAVELVEHSIRRFHSVNIVLKKRWRALPAGNPVRNYSNEMSISYSHLQNAILCEISDPHLSVIPTRIPPLAPLSIRIY